MDVLADLAAVQQRIAQITGVPALVPPPVAVQPPAAPAVAPGGFGGALQRALSTGSAADGTPGAGVAATPAPAPPAPVPPEQIDALVQQNAAAWQVDPALIKAVIANESGFDANATSATGAQGLMQLMPATAAGLGVRDPYDAAQNVAGGTRYLRGLLDRFAGNIPLAVAAYNAGPGAVEKYGGVPPYAETQHYVGNVLGSFDKYRGR